LIVTNEQKIAFGSILVYIYTITNLRLLIMARQSISFTAPNDAWLKEQVDGEEYSSKSELINDLIRQARKSQAQVDWIRAKLDSAEKSGFTDNSQEEIRQQAKGLING
jgi:antitoxin ParD1/3/4